MGINLKRSIRCSEILHLGFWRICSIRLLIDYLYRFCLLLWFVLSDLFDHNKLDMTFRIIQTFLLLVICLINSSTSTPLLWPLPKQLQINSTATPVDVSPCEVRYIIESPLEPYIDNLIKFYLERVFSCSSQTSSDFSLNIIVPAKTINIPL